MRSVSEKMMALALAEARKGWGTTSPNPMVGAVLADGEQVLGKGYHAHAGGPHAEVAALTAAGPRAHGATLYVTLEPCHHHGRTPPCTQAILKAGIRRVVIGCTDPNPRVAGGGAEFLAAQGVAVEVGILEKRCQDLNQFFNKFITTGRPFVLLKAAATLDGKLATFTGHSRWVTGEKARALVHRMRHGVDAILVGRATVETDNPSLNTRLGRGGRGRDPVRVVLDTGLNLDLSKKVFDRRTGGPTIVACGPRPDRMKVRTLEDRGIQVWPLPLHQGRVSLTALVENLGRKDLISLLIEGGAEVNYAALLDEKIVDKIMFFFAPKIIGGRSAPTLAGGEGVPTMNDCLPLSDLRIRRLGNDFLIEAQPVYTG